MRTVQAGLLACYRVVTATGVLNTAWGRTLFETTYWLYKRHYETGSIMSLQKWVKPGTVVIDVGANIGYFTLPFASWVRDGGKVLAIEPEVRISSQGRADVFRSRGSAVLLQRPCGKPSSEFACGHNVQRGSHINLETVVEFTYGMDLVRAYG
jgi:hypothetical protein